MKLRKVDRMFAVTFFGGLIGSFALVLYGGFVAPGRIVLPVETSMLVVLGSLALLVGEIKGCAKQLTESELARRLLAYMGIWCLCVAFASFVHGIPLELWTVMGILLVAAMHDISKGFDW